MARAAQDAQSFKALLVLLGGGALIFFAISIVVGSAETVEPERRTEPRKTTLRVRSALNASDTALLKQQLAFLRTATAQAAKEHAAVAQAAAQSRAAAPQSRAAAPQSSPPPPPPPPPAEPAPPPAREEWCRSHHRRHRVRPGVGWGSLSKPQRQEWMDRGCDEFFCEPNDRAGRGVYKCVPKAR